MTERENIVERLDLVREHLSYQKEHNLIHKDDKRYYTALEEIVIKALSVLRDQPEIIRCKNCKHRDPEDHKCDHHWHAYSPIPVDDDFWCAYGERY